MNKRDSIVDLSLKPELVDAECTESWAVEVNSSSIYDAVVELVSACSFPCRSLVHALNRFVHVLNSGFADIAGEVGVYSCHFAGPEQNCSIYAYTAYEPATS